MKPLLVRARGLLAGPEPRLVEGGLLVEGGRIRAVLDSAAAVRRSSAGARVVDLGDVVLAPGLVNAHAHLELSGLAGTLPRGPDFKTWIAKLVAARRARSARELAVDARAGAQRCLATGTTSVADVDTTGAARRGLAGSPLRVWLHREVLDAQDPSRTELALASVRRPLPHRARMREGISPHAPFSASPALLRGVAELARSRALPVAIHWSETREELEWLEHGRGAFAALLGPSPLRRGLDLIEDAGLLRAPLALVHGNHPAPGEAERIAAARAVVVHCPGSHAWFERERFALEHYRERRVALALGTDSLASNEDLDLRREMRLVRAAFPELAPREVWSMATQAGARAIGAEGEIGVLAHGAWADLAAHRCGARSEEAVLDALTSGATGIEGVWIAGERRLPT